MMTSPEAPARDEFFDSLLGDFLDESGQLLDRLNENLLHLDQWVRSLDENHHQRCDDTLMNEMFRAAHSLKGLSAMLGLKDINNLTHRVENVFDAARKDQLVIDGDVVELMFQAVDRLVALVDGLKDPNAEPVQCQPVIEGIRRVLQQAGAERQQSSQADAERALAAGLAETAAKSQEQAAAVPGPEPAAPVPQAEAAARPAAFAPAAVVDLFQDLRDEAEISDKYLLIFIDETELSLDELTETLLAREGGGSRAALEKLLVTSHRIKGSAASVGLNRAAKLAHLIEDLLQNLVETGGTLSPPMTEAMLRCTDALRRYVDALRTGHNRSDHFSQLARELAAAQHGEAASDGHRDSPHSASSPAPAGAAPLAHVTATCPEEPAPAAAKAAEPSAGSVQARAPSADAGGKPSETLRVDIDRLDQLMNLAGQLVINKARFAKIGDSLKHLAANKQSLQALTSVFDLLDKMTAGGESCGGKQEVQEELENLRNQARRIQHDLQTVRHEVEALTHVHGAVNDLGEAIHQLDRVTDAIQRNVMDTRMVPIGPLFARFKRVVRDITRANGKSVRLAISGEKTELDKRMIDELGDPLIHMVRNSADHGIELPEVRAAAGKPAEGTITLDAFHRGNSVVIQVRDDGKGLDAERILQKAVEKGLVTPADAERMTRSQIYPLIWEPGLTTAEKVTEVSGRGMGMDIVKSKIESLNGSIDLDSTPGQGTTLTIKLPLTLAILPSLMVEIGGEIYAMPIEAVVEIVSVGKRELATIHGVQAAVVRGRVISVVRLDEVFRWSRSTEDRGRKESDETTLVVVADKGQEIGMAVDRVLGEEDIVIKSMAENYRDVPGVAGASILGDGRVSLILDVVALIDMASHKAAAAAVS